MLNLEEWCRGTDSGIYVTFRLFMPTGVPCRMSKKRRFVPIGPLCRLVSLAACQQDVSKSRWLRRSQNLRAALLFYMARYVFRTLRPAYPGTFVTEVLFGVAQG